MASTRTTREGRRPPAPLRAPLWAPPAPTPTPARTPPAGAPGAALAMQRRVGNAITARVLSRFQGVTASELRLVRAPPELVAVVAALEAAKGAAAIERAAVGVVRACDAFLADTADGQAAAKVRALRRQALEQAGADAYMRSFGGAIPTYDTTAEKWTAADAPGTAAKDEDSRRFPQADPRDARAREVFLTFAQVRTVEDVDALDPAAVRDLNPQSTIPYRLLRDVLHESWHVAKEVLLDPQAPNGNRRALMTKLWEYRQWHHQEVLAEVMAELGRRQRDADALKPSKGAGSATLSSDIDVNLKGTHTELAVPLFNERFKRSVRLPEHVFTKEPGVVYDVNVYAIDFMHEFAPDVDAGSGRRTTRKEGARPGRPGGGIGDAALQAEDRRQQLVTSLFKARLFMTTAQWREYERATLAGLPKEGAERQGAAFRAAEERFAGYLAEMAAQIGVDVEALGDEALSGVERLWAGARAKAPGDRHDHAATAAQEDVLMAAANRIYERKLAAIHAARARLRALVAGLAQAAPDGVAGLERQIDQALLGLRAQVAEAAMYANEASMTDATIHHGVVGIQGGKEIDQQKAEGINAVNEHLADVMKEAGRYGPELGPAAFKAGKYLMRLGDAAKNLGFGYIWGVQVLYELGRKLSEDIKVRADKGGVDSAAESAAAVRAIAGTDDLDALLRLAAETAAQVVQEQLQERLAHARAGDPDTDTAFGHRTAPKKAENQHVLNQDMVHPVDRGAGKRAELQSAPLEDFAFRLTEAQLADVRRRAAERAAQRAAGQS